MQQNKNIFFYLVAVVVFITLKLGFKYAVTDDLNFLLQPTDKVIEVLTGSKSVYLSDKGYFHEQLQIIINKSCSGFNFWILCFLLFTFLMLRYFEKTWSKALTIPTAFILTYLLTIFVNSSRIFVSITIQEHTKNVFLKYQHIVHEAIGVMTNLSFLILAYVLLEKLLNLKRHHEKLT